MQKDPIVKETPIFYCNAQYMMRDGIFIGRSTGKRSRERSLEEASQILQKIPKEALHSLQSAALCQLVQLLLALQLEAVTVSSACRKLNQVISTITLT